MGPLDAVILVVGFVSILFGAELFTNGVEWLGRKLGLGAGATGSVLAAIGTAMPETVVPVVAIVFTNSAQADKIGVGAILGAPFMLATLVMLLIGVTAYVFREKRGRLTLQVDRAHATRDLGFFLVCYSVAVGLALLPPSLQGIRPVAGWLFIPAYVLYLVLVLRPQSHTAIDIEEEREEAEAFDALTATAYARRIGIRTEPAAPPLWLILVQVLLGFGAIVLGAQLFAGFIDRLSTTMGLNALLVSLLLVPLATELPEAANSLLWTRDGKDVIALGNVCGSMVLQSTIPVTFGVLLTPWQLGTFGTIAAIFALVAAALVFIQLRVRTRDDSLGLSALVLGGSLYVVFIAYVLKTVFTG
ncbi:MAG: sodium:calcium antiporter [Chloroflexota bacterium]|nr:sodium:calcium antiporter [Chloroflexota bacterium]